MRRRKVEPLYPARGPMDAPLPQRAAEPAIHEAPLGLLRLPDLHHDPPARLRAAGMERQPVRPVSLARDRVDPKARVARLVLLASYAVELQDQPCGHVALLSRVRPGDPRSGG